VTRPVDAKPRFQIRNPLLRQEFPWLVSEVVLLYRVERWWSSRPNA
jgi:hypothetical protein